MIVFRRLVGIVVVLCMSPVTGIQFRMTRNQVELGNPSGTYPVLTMTCTTDEPALYFGIHRESIDGSGWQQIVVFTNGAGGAIAQGLASYWTSANVTGSLQNPRNLAISVNASSLTCDDDRTYQCKFIYLKDNLQIITEVQNSSLRITALPSPPTLTARNWNTNMPINTGFNQDTPATMTVGEQVELTCVANIGSVSSRKIRWQKSSEINAGKMIDYTTNKDDGTAIRNSGSNHCTYSRTSTIRYNTTVIDSNRNEQMGLRFSCFFQVNQQETQQMFYIQVDGAASNNRVAVIVGVIIGVVNCVIIAAVTIFVVRRYRSKKGTSDSSTEKPTRYQFETNNRTWDVSYYNTRDNPMLQLPSNGNAAEENIVGGEEQMSVRTNTEATYYNEGRKEQMSVRTNTKTTYYNEGREEQMSVRTNTEATYYNEGSYHNYESLNDQNRDPTTYTSLQQVSSYPTNVETSIVDTVYENLNQRVV